jgi:hypothetical protein
MDNYDINVMRGCMHVLAALQDQTKTAYADNFAATHSLVKDEVHRFINNQGLKAEIRRKIAFLLLDYAFENYAEIVKRAPNEGFADSVSDVLRRRHPHGPEIPTRAAATDGVLENWQKTFFADNDASAIFRKGIYQIFRRHKPLDEDPHPLDHIVLTELVYVDPTAKKCYLIDSERNLYRGTLHISVERVAYFLYQRSVDAETNFRHRFYCLELEGRAEIYSAVEIRLGDRTRRPIASECLSVFVPPRHKALYVEFEALIQARSERPLIESGSSIADYIALSTPMKLKMDVTEGGRRIRDFPFLAYLAGEKSGNLTPFQEPIRALNRDDIIKILEKGIKPLKVYQRSLWHP